MNERNIICIMLIFVAVQMCPAQTVIRINSGGDSLTYQGKRFEKDFFYSSPSQVSTYTKQIPAIYKTERYSSTRELNYDLAVPNGNYSVTLHFMESYFGSITTGGTGSRVFDVSLEGTKVLDDFDIYGDAGPDAASIKQFNVLVNDGVLNIYFSSLVADGGTDYPKICAIEVLEISPGGGGGSPWSANGTDVYYGQGSVAIGTDTVPGGYRLAVDGKIIGEEVKVQLSESWPDYVFEKDYRLPTLEEVKKHIEEKGHLINIPSAREVEANGIELGEMNRLLLEKIEELTLYILEQETNYKIQNRNVEELSKEVLRLQQMIGNQKKKEKIKR